MRSVVLLFCFSLCMGNLVAQSTVKGVVVDFQQNPIIGANVYLEGTYDGGMSNGKGEFEFETLEDGEKILVVSFVSYETKKIIKKVSQMKSLRIKLREDVNTLDAVMISAGTFKAGDNSKVTTLKPLDVVTTASALGDPIAAFETMPGTSTVAEDGRLFVRGGSADETQIFIDGIRVFTPYSSTPNNTPSRGRYSPFLFDGMTFSTGGYSAEYGQALSGVLLLNTKNSPEKEKTDIGIMSVGGAIGNTQIWGENSLSINTSYFNLKPYLELFKDRNVWKKPFESASGEAVYRRKFRDGLLKVYAAFDVTSFEINQEDINFDQGIDFKLKNDNFYLNSSYSGVLNKNWSFSSGVSYTNANNSFGIQNSDINGREESFHSKLKFKKYFNSRFQLNFGTEYFQTNFNENFQDPTVAKIKYGFQNKIGAAFSELDMFFSKKLAFKAGLRAEYNSFNKYFLAPRTSLAYKTGKNSQVSLAYGDFYQNPSYDILKFSSELNSPKAAHYILNFQHNHDGKILRAEIYSKQYSNLTKFDTERPMFDSNFNSTGDGYANGLDVFWRDNKSIKNIDYWVSYSYLDTQRDYKNYAEKAQPNFVNKHNFSLVGKYWVENWKSQLGLSYNYASGRTYTNPNLGGFLNQKTKSYHSLSLNCAYLITQQKILYFSVNNVLGTKNVNGYQYANTPNAAGKFESRTLRPAADRFFFIGFFWTISEKGTDNQLDNL